MSEMIERIALAMQRVVQERGGKPIPGFMSRHLAAAAIQAMREPTNAMHKAMCDAYNSPVCIWMSGIDEALK